MPFGKNEVHYRSMVTKTEVMLAVITVAIVGVALAVIDPGGVVSQSIGSGQPQSSQEFGTGQVGTADYVGPFTATIDNFDALDITETRVDATDIVTTFYRQDASGVFTPLQASTGGSANLNASPELEKLFFSCEPAPAKDFYCSPADIESRNVRVLSFDFFDVNNDRTPEWMFEADATGLGKVGRAGDGNPSIPFTILSFDKATQTLTSGANQTGVGTGIQTSRLKYQLDFATSETAIPHLEYELTFNSSQTQLWQEGTTTLEIPMGDGVKSFRLTEFDRDKGTGTTTYTLDLADDFKDANYVTVCSSCDTNHEIPLVIDTNLQSASDGLTITLEIRSMTPSQGFETVHQNMKIVA